MYSDDYTAHKRHIPALNAITMALFWKLTNTGTDRSLSLRGHIRDQSLRQCPTLTCVCSPADGEFAFVIRYQQANTGIPVMSNGRRSEKTSCIFTHFLPYVSDEVGSACCISLTLLLRLSALNRRPLMSQCFQAATSHECACACKETCPTWTCTPSCQRSLS
eukprot:jgi/Botrbrau1/9649/Bobra.0131s0025.1